MQLNIILQCEGLEVGFSDFIRVTQANKLRTSFWKGNQGETFFQDKAIERADG